MTRIAATAAGLLCLGVPCRAQEAFEFSWEVKDVAGLGPANANGIIEPGEDAQIFFNVSFRPGVGGTAIWNTLGGTGQIGTVAGLGAIYGHIAGDANLATGDWIGIGYRSGFNVGIAAAIWTPSNELSWGFGQVVIPGETPNPLNDSWFLWARWRPLDFTPRDVRFHYSLTTPGSTLPPPNMLLDIGVPGAPQYVVDTWSHNAASAAFQIVPSPASIAPLLVLSWWSRQRRMRKLSREVRT